MFSLEKITFPFFFSLSRIMYRAADAISINTINMTGITIVTVGLGLALSGNITHFNINALWVMVA